VFSRSLRIAKLTNRRKSEKTSRFCPSNFVASPGDGDKTAAAASVTACPPTSRRGRETPLAVGLMVALIVVVVAGSMSKDDRNDVFDNSSMVLVKVTNLSKRAFASLRGVPLRSSTY
jgi:hypothetical protein